jgi:hypothetical protein
MHNLVQDTIGGFNKFIQDQKNLPDKATMTLIQFDHEYRVDYNGIPMENVKELDSSSYTPRGNTALLDALNKAILETKTYIDGIAENNRPGRVVVVVVTDGGENSSKEIKKDDLKKLVTECESNLWRFVFMGANIDAFSEASSLGMLSCGATLQYEPTEHGLSSSYESLSRGMRGIRGMDYGSAVSCSTSFFEKND